ncbi:MAG: hypothetical protein R2865_00195 [Deinococcales bacterium]
MLIGNLSLQLAQGSGEVKRNFADLAEIPIEPDDLYIKLFLADEVLITLPANFPACRIEITDLRVMVTVKDQSQSLDLPVLRLNKRLVLEPLSQSSGNAQRYHILRDDTSPAAIVGVIRSTTLKTLLNLITTGGDNEAQALISAQSFSIPELPSQTSLRFRFSDSQGIVSF